MISLGLVVHTHTKRECYLGVRTTTTTTKGWSTRERRVDVDTEELIVARFPAKQATIASNERKQHGLTIQRICPNLPADAISRLHAKPSTNFNFLLLLVKVGGQIFKCDVIAFVS